MIVEHDQDSCDECGADIEIDEDGAAIEPQSDNGSGGVEHECDPDEGDE